MITYTPSLIERLNLQVDEVNCLRSSEMQSLIQKLKRCGQSPSKHNLWLKLRIEARRRMLKHKMEELPSVEDIEVFCISLQNSAAISREEDGKLVIDYNSYKKAVSVAPVKLRPFLSAKTFMDLLRTDNVESDELVSIDSIAKYLRIRKDKTSKIINLHYYDSAGKGYLTANDLQEYLEGEVLPHIPALANLNDEEPMLLDYYLCIVTRKFFFLLDTMRQKKIRIIDIVASRLLEEFDALNNESVTNYVEDLEGTERRISDSSNWTWGRELEDEVLVAMARKRFSKENCLRVKDLYTQLDADANGLLSLSEMTDFQGVTNSFMQRVFEVQQTYDNAELDLRGFCDLLFAMENKSDHSALNYYFRVLDVDGDNLLTASDLYFFYRDLAKMLEECVWEDNSQKVPSFEDIKNEIFDMCHSKDSYGITLKDLISSGKGGTVVGILTDLDAFLEYENREDIISEE